MLDVEVPKAVGTISMLQELGTMSGNLLEYVLGEEEEEQQYCKIQDEVEDIDLEFVREDLPKKLGLKPRPLAKRRAAFQIFTKSHKFMIK